MFANGVGAVVVVLFLFYLGPSRLSDAQFDGVLERGIPGFIAYMAFALPFGRYWAARFPFRPIEDWLSAERPATVEERAGGAALPARVGASLGDHLGGRRRSLCGPQLESRVREHARHRGGDRGRRRGVVLAAVPGRGADHASGHRPGARRWGTAREPRSRGGSPADDGVDARHRRLPTRDRRSCHRLPDRRQPRRHPASSSRSCFSPRTASSAG